MSSRVSYFYDNEVGTFYYGSEHPMKPFRIKMAHQLIVSYGLYRKMNVYQPHRATDQEMTAFHSPEYIQHLKKVAPRLYETGYGNANLVDPTSSAQVSVNSSAPKQGSLLKPNMGPCAGDESSFGINKNDSRFKVGENDCPSFEGMFEFSQISSGASIDAAIKLNHKSSDICINWAGGLHHAKKQEASGFCYVNDIVLAILELLKYHNRVLYIDIDVHHGDGVEEAFYTTNRVMTVSFHRYGDFFPGTGDLKETGYGEGEYYSLNVPLKQGITDDSFYNIYKTIMESVRERFRPDAVVIQCGADSLAYDKLGTHNCTIKGHGQCIQLVKSWDVPLLVLGGGGYTIKNVARCWAYETALCLNRTDIENNIPQNDYYEYYGPDYKMHFAAKSDEPDQNSKDYLDFVLNKTLINLKALEHAPNVGVLDYAPRDFFDHDKVEQRQTVKASHQAEDNYEYPKNINSKQF